VQAVRILSEEGNLPLVITQCGDVAIVGPVKELVPRPFNAAFEGGQQVVAIDVDLERRVAHFLTFQQILLGRRISRRGE